MALSNAEDKPLSRETDSNLIHGIRKTLRPALRAFQNLDQQYRLSPLCRADPVICLASPQEVARVAALPLANRSELQITPDDRMHTFMLLAREYIAAQTAQRQR
jgi:hypothetical protein